MSVAEDPGTGLTRKPSLVREIWAPSASRQEMVASMSADVDEHSTKVVPGAKAAQMRSLCASDFDEGATTSPLSVLG